MTKSHYTDYLCPNVLCRKSNCFSHCNNCGLEIKWTNYLGDPYFETNKKGKRVRYAYENNDTVHRCMQSGTRTGKYYNKRDDEPNEYILDEHRTITRYSGPVFICNICNRKADLPVMLQHHKDNKMFECDDKLMEKFFKEKPKTFINTKDHRLSEYE